MKRTRLISAAAVLIVLSSLSCSGVASAAKTPSHKTYALGAAKKCRIDFVKRTERHIVKVRVKVHGHYKKVKRTRKYVACVYVAPKKASPVETVTAPVTIVTPAPSIALRVELDPTYTQDASNPLEVTWSFDVSATETQDGITQDDETPPSGVAEFFVDGNLSQSVNVGGDVTGGTIETTLASYGDHTTDLVYDAGSESATTGTESVTIEPPAISVADTWPMYGPTASMTISGSTAQVSVTDANWEGAQSVTLTDQLGDSCTASISGTVASCVMSVTGTPTSLTIAYPGGVSTTTTQPLSPGGVQQVTTTWPAESYTIQGSSLDVVSYVASVSWDGGYVRNGTTYEYTWDSEGTPPSNTLDVTTGSTVAFQFATAGNIFPDSSICDFGIPVNEQKPCGYLDLTVNGQAFALPGDGDPSCSDVMGDSCSDGVNYGGEPIDDFYMVFDTPGTYVVSVEYVSQDGLYSSTAGPTETIVVS